MTINNRNKEDRMKSNEFVAIIREKVGCSKVEAKECFDAIVFQMKASLMQDTPVDIFGFGKISTKTLNSQSATMRRNPLTGERFMGNAIPERRGLKIKIAKRFKDLLNGS